MLPRSDSSRGPWVINLFKMAKTRWLLEGHLDTHVNTHGLSSKSADSPNHSQLYICSSGPCDVLKEYFGNFPMRNDGTCPRRSPFSSPRHSWPFKLINVTLQPNYTCCLRVMGENPALQKLLFDHLASVPVFDYCKY